MEKIICLGKEFISEEERREYYRNELRTKLPELKKIEGFPIGEDDDIINLSDPPYYTACPNPWLNDFIAEWEKEKEHIPGRKKDFHVEEPYAGDVSEGKNNAIYTAHSYHTKVPHIAIMRYLLHYTQPGDTVLDVFGGTGMTAVAGQFCDNPDIETKTKLEQEWQKIFGTKPEWGSRKTILGDLSPLASFIAYNYNSPIDPQEFDKTAQKIIDEVKKELSWMYETKHTDGRIGSINYTVWSEVFACGNCGGQIVFWDNAVDEVAGEVRSELQCPHCKSFQTKNTLERFWITSFDAKLNESIKQTKFIPALIHYSVGTKSYLKKPDKDDLQKVENIDEISIPSWYPISELPNGYNTQQPIKSNGLTHAHHFYTKRNLTVLSLFYSKLPLKFKVLFTSMLNRSSRMVMTVMSNYFAQLKGKTVGGWAGKPMNGTLYVPSISTEVAVLESLSSRFNSLLKLQIAKRNFHDNFFSIVKQDLVISCYKPSEEFESKFKTLQGDIAVWDFVSEHLRHLPAHIRKENSTTAIVERSPKIIFDRLITFYLMRGLPVPIDARDFQEGIKQRFVERDGMYFTAEQAAEYDEKKSRSFQFVQLSLIVTNESDAIEWLKDRLRKNAQKYQDIMPEFRIATQSLRKGDTLPELQDILNESFIQDADGKWRTPNPNEAKDREALRTKVLLKEFNGYVAAISQPRARKLKEVRVEALRTGFKNCWEQKDFKTIVIVSDMISQNILLEDEQLLMFYDIAKDRV